MTFERGPPPHETKNVPRIMWFFAGHDGYVMKIYFSIKQINLNQISWFLNIFLPWQEYRNKEYFKATFSLLLFSHYLYVMLRCRREITWLKSIFNLYHHFCPSTPLHFLSIDIKIMKYKPIILRQLIPTPFHPILGQLIRPQSKNIKSHHLISKDIFQPQPEEIQ